MPTKEEIFEKIQAALVDALGSADGAGVYRFKADARQFVHAAERLTRPHEGVHTRAQRHLVIGARTALLADALDAPLRQHHGPIHVEEAVFE